MSILTVYVEGDSGPFAHGHSQVIGHTGKVLPCVCVYGKNRQEASCGNSFPVWEQLLKNRNVNQNERFFADGVYFYSEGY